MEQVKIVKQDHQGKGIGYVNDCIIFVPKVLVGETVEVEITKAKKNFQEGVVRNILVSSERRVEAKCPYYFWCGGCDFQHVTYPESVLYKKQMLMDSFQQSGLWKKEILVESCDTLYFYRNKITLKVEHGRVGFYSYETHDLVEISECVITRRAINEVLKDFSMYHFQHGELMIRCNENDEILMDLITTEEVLIDSQFFQRHKIVGILKNHNCVYGESFFYERKNGVLYQVSFDSFFQVNPSMSEKLFMYVRNVMKNARTVLDLYCGVGTLGLQTEKSVVSVTGIEVVSHAILNAVLNAKLNGRTNFSYHLGKVEDVISKISSEFDLVIVDPPRNGMDLKAIETILKIQAKNVVYVSCNPSTLIRDLKKLESIYQIESIQGFDMFPNTKHVECVCVLNRR